MKDKLEKKEVAINSQVNTFEKAKELLVDLEVLNEKYDIVATVTICPQGDTGILSYGSSMDEIDLSLGSKINVATD